MYSLIYRFQVKPGREEDLIRSWTEITEGYLEHGGSLGSRLHTSEAPLVYVAYAQWPNREQRESAELPEQYRPAQQLMADSCEKIETMHQLQMIEDRLIEVSD